MTYLMKLVALLMAVGLVAAACGGGTSVSVESSDAPADEPSDDAVDDTAPSGDAEDDTPPSGDDGDDGDDGGSSSGGFSTAGFCAFAQEREEAENRFSSVNFFIPEELEAALDENADLLEQAIQIAPDEIRADLEIIQADFELFRSAFAAVDYDASQMLDTDIEEAPGSEEATERVDDYIRDECGIDPDANDDAEPTDDDILEDLEESGNSDEVVRQALLQIGLTDDQATCISQTLSLEELAALADADVSDEVIDIFVGCGISLEELATLGGADPDAINDQLNDDLDELGALPPEAVAVFVDELVNQGFTEEEAECLAGEMFDGDVDLINAIEVCDIPISRLAELGG